MVMPSCLKQLEKPEEPIGIYRVLGSFTMILEFFSGQWKRGFKRVANKFIGRNIVRRLFFK